MTIAERIAALFGNDGTVRDCYRDRYDDQQLYTLHFMHYPVRVHSTLDEECRDADGVYVTDRTVSIARYLFPDGSAIIDMESGWDIGYAHCWCCQSIGHSDECREQTRPTIRSATLEEQGIIGY